MKIISQTSNEIKIEAWKEPSKEEEIANDLTVGYSLMASFFVLPILVFVAFPISKSIVLNGFKDFSLAGVLRINCVRVEPQQVDCQVSKSKDFGLIQGEPTSIKFVKSANYSVKNVGYSRDFFQGKIEIYERNFQITSKFGESKTFESSQDSGNAAVNSVNSFLASQQNSLNHISDDRTNPKILGSLAIAFLLMSFILFGCFFVIRVLLKALAKKSIVLNNSQQSFNYIETRLILGEKKDSYKFTDVTKVDILYSTNSYDKIFYKPRITMNSGVKYNLDTISDRQVAIKVANDLNRFMGLPEEEDPVVKE